MKKRVAVGAGLSLGAAFGMTATADAASFTVTNTDDSGGGSLRAAITAANSNANPLIEDSITFQSGLTGEINLGSELPTVSENLAITGPGASTLAIDGQLMSWRLMRVNTVDLTITGLTLTGGDSATSGGAIYNDSGDLTVRNSTLSGNVTAVDGGAIYAESGATTTIEGSTISGNTSSMLGSALRIYTSGLTIRDSTISNNLGVSAPAISIRMSASPIIEGTTISGNSGAGIFGFNTGDIPLDGTIVANNNGGGDDLLSGGAATPNFDLAFSLVEDASAVTVVESGPNLLGADPQLGGLALNGGATQTQLPAASSPVIDKSMDTGTDQRGLTRAADMPSIANAAGGNGADIGAVELQLPPATTTPPPTPAKKKKKCKKKKKKRSAAAAKKCKKK